MANKKLQPGIDWFASKDWKPFPFQLKSWEAMLAGQHGIVNAPTGSGKTYALFLGVALDYLSRQPKNKKPDGLQAIWITPIRALSKEIYLAIQRAVLGLGLDWEVAMRTGDTSAKDRRAQKKNPPQVLITTPESLHLLLATPGYPDYFRNLRYFIADEWHELIGSKRGVQVELALSRLKGFLPELRIWGISATIGNLEEAMQVLLGDTISEKRHVLIRSGIKKKIAIQSIIPKQIERFPWSGHLGLKLLKQVVSVLYKSSSTLIFTNTRSQCEIWYQKILEAEPDLAGWMAMHHSSISRELRDWVEESLHEGNLKAVVCTSSLDLGVDFRPVETIIQIGGPKGVSRFMQRAGRSGHQPGGVSKIHFVPTHALELIEAAALREAIEAEEMESRIPYIRSFDVLVQYLVTLSVSEGFLEGEVLEQIKGTFAFRSITDEEWAWCLTFITTGGSLDAYDEYRRVGVDGEGKFRIMNKNLATRHRLSMGTIVSDASLTVQFVNGKRLGNIEERFISQIKPGDVFWFAGRPLELVRIRGNLVQVKRSGGTKGKIPAWIGGRLPLSAQMSKLLRKQVSHLSNNRLIHPELKAVLPIAELQGRRSALPEDGEFLIEYFETREGYHLLVYPFEGRFVHEGLASLLAYRIAQSVPITFSIAMNDYGFELLSDQPIPIDQALSEGLLSSDNLTSDIQASINSVEMARRRFRDIASIAGLVFHGFPGRQKKDKHIQSSSNLLFEVFEDYDKNNLLYLQAFEEVRTFQLEIGRLRKALKRIAGQKIVLTKPDRPTPFSFPIIVDRLRERLSSEKLEDRIRKMTIQLERD